ncbi:site-specific integrase [bacterium]|jgi:integrase|nr:site-specific integrase [bacterium]
MSDLKIKEVLRIYAEHLKQTISNSRGAVAVKHLEFFADMTVRQVAANVQAYIDQRKVSPGTINRELGVLQAALRYAFKRGDLDFIPALMKMPSPPPRTQFLTDDEIKALVEDSRGYPVLHLFIRIALMTGQRKEAILSLRWDQVDFNANLIDFNDDLDPLRGRRKGRGVVPMSTALRGLLMSLKRVSPWVIQRKGKRVKTIRRQWDSLMRDTGLDITPHILRHTVATQLAQKNVPIPQIARILGHSDSRITERVYAKFSPEFCRQAVTHLNV